LNNLNISNIGSIGANSLSINRQQQQQQQQQSQSQNQSQYQQQKSQHFQQAAAPTFTQSLLGDEFYKPNNLNKLSPNSTVTTTTSSSSLSMYSDMQQMNYSSLIQSIHSTGPSSMSYQPFFTQMQAPQQLQETSISGSPSRARDRHLFNKLPSNEAQSLPLIKGVCIT
jgi:hypothetical protein